MELNVYNRTREKGYALYKKYFIQILNKTIREWQMGFYTKSDVFKS